MRSRYTLYIAAVLTSAALAIAACSKDSSDTDAPSAPPVITDASASRSALNDVDWGPVPSVLPPGAQIAVLEGDPFQAVPFTLRLKMPNGYTIPPHTHPTTENVTVLSGTFFAGMGTQFDESKLQAFGKDAFASIPANHAHFAKARGETVVQVHGIGPFAFTYINQAAQAK